MGVSYDIGQNRFLFNFEHDGRQDLIHLTGSGYEVEAFGKCFHYGYEFEEDVPGSVRTAFIKHLKFPARPLREEPDLTQFMQKAVNNLHRKVNLYNYDLVITPESSSVVNEYMVRYIYRFAQPMMRRMQLVKALPANIGFDIEGWDWKTFASEEDKKLCTAIRGQNILVVDDIATSGSTLNEVLRTLRVLNEDNSIVIFSLLGRKDLMAETA